MALKVSLSENNISKPFSFSANCKDLEGSVQKGIATHNTSVAGTKNFLIVATKSGRVYLAALGTDTFVILRVPNAQADSVGAFSFESDKLLGIIKGRSNMTFNYTENQECEFKLIKGKYSGKILTLPITDDMVTLFNDSFSPLNESKSKFQATFSPETLELVKEGLAVTSVKDVFNGTSLLSYIAFKGKKVNVSTFDNHHFGYYQGTSDYKGKDFSIASPITHFQLVEKLVNGYGDTKDHAAFSIQKETLRVDTDSFIVVLPLMQADEKNFDLIPSFLKGTSDPDFVCNIDLEELSTIINNLFTLHSPNTSFDFSFKEGSNQLKVTFSSTSGTASDSIKVNPGKFKSLLAKVEPKVFKDTIDLARTLKETVIRIKADKCIVIQAQTKLGATITLVCSLV